MKLHFALLGVLACMAAQSASKPSQDSGAQKPRSGSTAQQVLTGCIDEQEGRYVLLNDQMAKITSLRSPGEDREVFAKHLGQRVKLTGIPSSGQKAAFRVSSIEHVSGACGPAK